MNHRPENERLLEEDEDSYEILEHDIALRPLRIQPPEAKPFLNQDSDSPTIKSPHATWTPEEEKRLVRKLDYLVMPLLIIAFFALQLDRGSMISG